MAAHRIESGTEVRLVDVDPDATDGWDDGKKAARARLAKLRGKLADLQHLLWADGRHRLLVVLQAMDSGGKDGTIRNVFEGVNPQGVRVASFKAPTSTEISHDYLWRVHQKMPAAGEIVVFNRSHYEDVLVVRVLDLVPQERWERRYEHINAFEQMLADEGTTILKFYLHISREEQAERFRSRLDNPKKRWKFNAADLDHRRRWDDYMTAFEAVLSRTSTPDAPWFVVPANHKWYRDLVVAETLIETLEGLDLRYPSAEPGIEEIVVT